MKYINVPPDAHRVILGRRGENLARTLAFDIGDWLTAYGEGTVQLLHQRAGDEAPYPCVVEQSGGEVRWCVTNADTAQAGRGRLELRYYVGETLAKSCVYITEVALSLTDDTADPPEPQQGWVDQVLEAVADLKSAAVSDEQVAAAVAAYLTENPVEETDPTVPAWAKAESKPTYTAEEVGALPADTEIPAVPDVVSAFQNDAGYLTEHQDLSGYAKTEDIPSIPETLPNPYALTFTGAVDATYDGSGAVSVEIPSGGSEEWSKETVTLSEAVSEITIPIPSAKKVLVYASLRLNDADNSLTTGSGYGTFLVNGRLAGYPSIHIRQANRFWQFFEVEKAAERTRVFYSCGWDSGINWSERKPLYHTGWNQTNADDSETIDSISFKVYDSNYVYGEGVVVEVFYK